MASKVKLTEAMMDSKDYAEGEAPWSEDEQFAEQARACRSRRKLYGQSHCDEKDGTCTECEYDAQTFLRKTYSAPAGRAHLASSGKDD